MTCNDGSVDDEPRVDANIDFSTGSGYFVRLDVELESFDGSVLAPGHLGWVTLSADEAATLAEALTMTVERVRELVAEDDERMRAAGKAPRVYRR